MRLHTFTLVVFTAVLAHSANSAKTPSSTTTEGAPSASPRSSDACCDDVPVEKGLGPHETTAGEERMPDIWQTVINKEVARLVDMVYAPEEHISSKINSAVARLVELVHAHERETMPAVEHLPVNGQRVFDENAVKHFFRFGMAHETLQDLLERVESYGRQLESKSTSGLNMIATARELFSKHLRAEAEARFKLDPSVVFGIRLQKAISDPAMQADARSKDPMVNLDLGNLDRYRKEYYRRRGGNELTLREVLSKRVGGDAKLESILSILNRNKLNKRYVVLMRTEMMADSKTVVDAAVKLGMIPHTTEVLDNKYVDIFVLFIGTLAREHPEQHSVIVEQLTEIFGGRQAALLVHKSAEACPKEFDDLRAALYKHLVKTFTYDELRDEITKSREGRTKRPGRAGSNTDKFETRCEDLVLENYLAPPEPRANRKRKRASDTSAGPS
ncbi:unnamed protein product [Hyaloperonospora brassicae]|uniref:RxLR effector candidate protein n=1 Tax=Hyaloperonospora brassicae TaxID=162125 RepID=A0AAV0UAL8_HYABA|nr:unnamed protein product [Hyaloperonospora brassicae]